MDTDINPTLKNLTNFAYFEIFRFFSKSNRHKIILVLFLNSQSSLAVSKLNLSHEVGTSKFYHLPGPLGGLGPILTRFLSLLVSELLRKLNTYQKKRLMVRQISKFSLIIKSAIARIPNCFFGRPWQSRNQCY